MPQQKVRIQIPKGYRPRERQAIAKEVIDFIIQRTQNGFDKNGKKFKGYSKSYKESKAFKSAGKSASPVDLTFSGEMLASLQELTNRSGFITIGYEKGDEELNGKVEGNRKGTYGNSRPVTKPRDYLGISKTALERILSRYPLAKEAIRRQGEDDGSREDS